MLHSSCANQPITISASSPRGKTSWNCQELTQPSTPLALQTPAPEDFARGACKRSLWVTHSLGNHQLDSSPRITGIAPWVSAFGCAGPLVRGSDNHCFAQKERPEFQVCHIQKGGITWGNPPHKQLLGHKASAAEWLAVEQIKAIITIKYKH